jgi:hypothetical protein
MRVGVLAAMFVVAYCLMRDLGFTPGRSKTVLHSTREVLDASLTYGLKNPPVRWVMLSAPFSAGVAIYTFYALQPYLLGLYGNPKAFTVAGLAAAIVAGAQIAGGYLAPRFRRLFRKRTTSLILGALLNAAILGASIVWLRARTTSTFFAIQANSRSRSCCSDVPGRCSTIGPRVAGGCGYRAGIRETRPFR